jgi:hypothetical protein
MELKFLDIHFEAVNEGKGRLEELQKIVEQGIPCAISIAPYTLEQQWYDETTIDLLNKAFKQGAILGQQGYGHKCRYEHRFSDPWHENYCPYHGEFSRQSQVKTFKQGRETLLKHFEKQPELYVPPNHLYGQETLAIASNLGYKFFVERGLSQKKPYKYKYGDMIILPEVKLGKKGIIFYVHYDKIKEKQEDYDEVSSAACDFSWIKPQEVSRRAISKNQRKVRKRKILRDVVKLPIKIKNLLKKR